MSIYKSTTGQSVIRIADGALIPFDPENTDYATYVAWVAAGNTPLPADPRAFDFEAAAKDRETRIIKRLSKTDLLAALARKVGIT